MRSAGSPGNGEAGTVRPPAATEGARPGHPPSLHPSHPAAERTDGRTDRQTDRPHGRRCEKRRRLPAMFSRSSRKRLSSRSVSVPHRSGTDLRAPSGHAERPSRASLRPAAAHLWPQVSQSRGWWGARAGAGRRGRG